MSPSSKEDYASHLLLYFLNALQSLSETVFAYFLSFLLTCAFLRIRTMACVLVHSSSPGVWPMTDTNVNRVRTLGDPMLHGCDSV